MIIETSNIHVSREEKNGFKKWCMVEREGKRREREEWMIIETSNIHVTGGGKKMIGGKGEAGRKRMASRKWCMVKGGGRGGRGKEGALSNTYKTKN